MTVFFLTPANAATDYQLGEVYRECASYLRRFGEHVIEIEYTDNGRTAFRRACSTHGRQISVLLRDRDLATNHHRNYVYEAC